MDAITEPQADEERSGFALMVAERIRNARRSARMKLKDVAIICATTPQTIQRLETGNMTMSVAWLGKLCHALEIEPIDLFEPRPPVNHICEQCDRPIESPGEIILKTCSFCLKSAQRIIARAHGEKEPS